VKHILVTGGLGFIGKHLVKRLEDEGHNIHIIDIKGGSNLLDIDEITNKHYDIIYHLAANADVRGGIDNTTIDLENNIIATHRLLEYMRMHNCKKLVFASSATIYGERDDFPIPEDAPDLRPISLYGASKLSAEHLIEAYSHMFGINANIFRFGNIVGEGNTHGVINDFVRKLQKNPKKLEILGNGNQIKQYLHVNDCINALMNISIEEGVNIYNLAHDDTMPVSRLASIVIDEMELDAEIEYTGGDRGWIGDVPVTIIDNSKMKECGWKPTVSVEDGIRRTVRWLIDNQ